MSSTGCISLAKAKASRVNLSAYFDGTPPYGQVRARLDWKIWGRNPNVLLCLFRSDSGAQFSLTAWRRGDDLYPCAPDGLNFAVADTPVNEWYELDVSRNDAGNPAWLGARRLGAYGSF